MKKVLSIIIAIVMMCAITIPAVSAESFNESVPVTYSAPDTFVLNIPAQIVVGERAYITAESLNIRDTKQVEVTFGGFTNYNTVSLYDDNDPTNTVSVYFFNNDNDTMSPTDNVVATFSNTNPDASFILDSQIVLDDRVVKAGEYSGAVYFTADCVDV